MHFLKNIFRNVLATIFTIVSLPIFLLLAVFFVAYRNCVDFILRKKFGEKYGGLLSGGDSFFALESEVTKSVINILLLVDSPDRDFFATVKDCFRKRIFDAPERLPKFTGVCRKAYGYFYVLKDEYSVDECVREVQEDVRNEADLQKIFNKFGNLPLPKNHETFWEVLVCKAAIKWNDSKNCFPIILRCNHSMSDGANLLETFTKFLNDDAIIYRAQPAVGKSTVTLNVFLRLQKLLFEAYIAIKLPSFLLLNVVLKGADSNSFQDKTLSRTTLLTWKIADGNMIAKIKKIKNKIPGTTFTDVLLAATSASFEEYMAKEGLDVPENLRVGYPIALNPIEYFEKTPVLANGFSALMVPIPIRWRSNSVIDKLKEVSRRQGNEKKKNGIHVRVFACCFQFADSKKFITNFVYKLNLHTIGCSPFFRTTCLWQVRNPKTCCLSLWLYPTFHAFLMPPYLEGTSWTSSLTRATYAPVACLFCFSTTVRKECKWAFPSTAR